MTQNDGNNALFKNVTIEIPEGTTRVIPLLKGLIAVYGGIISNDNDTFFDFSINDQHLGVVGVNLFVAGMGAGNATLGVEMQLRDNNGDNQWSGVVGVTVLSLGPLQ
jgi:hypothetical protein